MNDSIMNLSLGQLACAYIFIIFVIGLVRYKGINREKDIVLATFRMTVQLVLTGYVLIYIFDNPSPFMTLLIILVMEIFSIYTVIKKTRSRQGYKRIQKNNSCISPFRINCMYILLFTCSNKNKTMV